MLKRLKIENFVLMKTCEIHFSPSLNILTGETGTGKSVLLLALQLLLGKKAESETIRHGESSAVIEGSFVLKEPALLLPYLKAYELDPACELTLRREIVKNGKHKTFLNGIIVPVTLIREIAPLLLEHCDIESSFLLRNQSYALEKLDLFADLLPLQESFRMEWTRYLHVQEQLHKLTEEERFQEVELEQLENEICALQSLHLDSLSEEELFEKYQNASLQKKKLEALSQMEEILEKEPDGIFSRLYRMKQIAHQAQERALYELLEGALSQLKETSYAIQRQKGDSFLTDEERLKIEKQLAHLDSLKRKFHAATTKELQEVLLKKRKRKEELLSREEVKLALVEDMQKAKADVDRIALSLSASRKEAAKDLAQKIELHIRSLNMAHATFTIHISMKERSHTGDDECAFFFVPNPGERTVSVHTGASNGELARIFLALSAIVASKERVSTILFDEVDANIGGMTALAVGALLEDMSKTRQVLAITHFPQVAQFAHAHFALAKEVVEERTVTSISHLRSSQERKQEHLRMSGKK